MEDPKQTKHIIISFTYEDIAVDNIYILITKDTAIRNKILKLLRTVCGFERNKAF